MPIDKEVVVRLDLKELLQSDENQTRQYFYNELRDTESARSLSEVEAHHVSSVLAHYAQVTYEASSFDLPPVASVTALQKRLTTLDALAYKRVRDQETMRIAAVQCLFALAVYGHALQRKADRIFLEDHGRLYYLETSHLSPNKTDAATFELMSQNLLLWVEACQELQGRPPRFMLFLH